MLYNVMDRSFALVRADWPVGKVHGIVERLAPSHVILVLSGNEDRYYLFRTSEVGELLVGASATKPITNVLQPDRREPTPALSIYDDELEAPDQAVVLEEERVVGFVDFTDITQPPPILRRVRGHAPESEGGQVARALVSDFPSSVAVGETASLLVWLSANTTASQYIVAAYTGMLIDIIVRPRRGLELLGASETSIVVTDTEETQPVRFQFKATEVGLGVIQIYIFAGAQLLTRFTVESQVVTADSSSSIQQSRKQESPLPLIQVADPDLSLIIMEHNFAGRPQLTFKLKTREQHDSLRTVQQFSSIPITLNPQEHFRSFFAQIQNLPLDSERDRRIAEEQLTAKGTDLYKALVPEDLRTVLWALRERIRSVQVQSEEPWIPWELCKLQGWQNGRIVDGQFFCEAFAITRWLPRLQSKITFSLRKIALVMPTNSGLPNAENELAYMCSLSNSDRRVERIPARLEEILAALKGGNYDCWHFTGHGSALSTNPDLAELELEDGDTLRPENVSGEVENLGLPKPLVFLNACQSGRSGLALTGVGGWAMRFLTAASSIEYPEYGAAAFVGTYWKIDDNAALAFAKAFYGALLEESKTIGEAVQAARLAVKPLGDSTWLAYTVFAHPLAKVAQVSDQD